MRIQCPSCLAAYEVPDAKITGRKVRCARCGTQWAPPAPAMAEAFAGGSFIDPFGAPRAHPTFPPTAVQTAPADSFADGMPAPVPFFPAPGPLSQPPRRPAGGSFGNGPQPMLITAWLGTLLVVLAIIALAVIERAPIIEAWPPSARLYALLGLH